MSMDTSKLSTRDTVRDQSSSKKSFFVYRSSWWSEVPIKIVSVGSAVGLPYPATRDLNDADLMAQKRAIVTDS